jgi:hypothetical protein
MELYPQYGNILAAVSLFLVHILQHIVNFDFVKYIVSNRVPCVGFSLLALTVDLHTHFAIESILECIDHHVVFKD